ncbi:MAG TPA: beta-propeller fold lactonase family protein [Burkholderiaceae bacterium]|jgi:6-phosphogluconolactonase (cycloisomerase 2 family)
MNQQPTTFRRPRGHLRAAALLAGFALTALVAACGGDGDDGTPGLTNQLYTETNETANMIVHFVRKSDGTLVRLESTATGGAGVNAVSLSGATGPDSLVSQHAVTMKPDGTELYAVNAGDNSISVLAVNPSTGVLTLKRRTVNAGGLRPNSLAYNNGFLYATFQQGTIQLAAYKILDDGSLTQVGAYNLATLGHLVATSVAPTQLVASPDGAFIVVSAGTAANAVMSFGVNADGTLAAPTTNTAPLATPFAGAFQPTAATPTYLSTSISGNLLTSYSFSTIGALSQLGQAAAVGVSSPCWLTFTPDGSTAFVGNGSGSISSYSVGSGGVVTLLNSVAASEPSPVVGGSSVAADSWVSPDGKFMYTAYLGDDKIVAYSIAADGSLGKLGETVIGTATQLSLQGLAGN